MLRQPRTPMVLIVDDEPANLLTARAALAPLGCDVATASDVSEADLVMSRATPDLILLDTSIPGDSGIEVCRRWRRDAAWDEVPIILLTALTAPEYRSIGVAAGADDFLEKPLDEERLAVVVRRWLAIGRRPSIRRRVG